ncbi:MAG TPA: GAF domain-containing SpoIIE family protein phosphatase [Gaiellaceae bacterium]
MVVRVHDVVAGVSTEALAELARALGDAAGARSRTGALAGVAAAVRVAASADVAVIRVQTTADRLEAVAVAAQPALAAELEGTRLALDELPAAAVDELERAPGCARRAAERAAARVILVLPIRADGHAATLELYRGAERFDETERLVAELAARHVALVLRAFAVAAGATAELTHPALELAGEALAAALDSTHTAAEIARVSAGVVGAPVGLLWDPDLALLGSYGVDPGDLEAGGGLVDVRALVDRGPPRAGRAASLPGGCSISVSLPLGQPPVGILQLLFGPDDEPTTEQLARLTTFGVRAAYALRRSSRAQSLALELDRTRALLAVVGQATAELSLAHTLDTAVDLIVELLDVPSVALYLYDEQDGLTAAAERGLVGPHVRVAERLLELALGPVRGRSVVEVHHAAHDSRLQDARDAAREAGIDAALAVPLLVRDSVVGLLAVYGRTEEQDASLLAALAGQLAVAVQNAQLHEQATEFGRERQAALAAERAAVRSQRAIYEISRTFAEGRTLDDMLEVLTKTVVEVLDLDAAVIAMPDGRRELLEPRSLYVSDQQLEAATRVILFRPQPFGAPHVQRLFRDAQPYRGARGHDLLEPFLARGWTAAVIPVGTPVTAALTILSFRPGRPLSVETIDAATAIASQAALALENARLYQQQKEFADTMQRSLLPRGHPDIAGLEVGEVYESSAQVDVGGDVYDFLELPDGRLAVVLGDVTGHGVEATADMAMAKFVFRSLAREHPEPGDFLARANDVVVDEIAPGKFITMTYVTVDGSTGEVACANAGHPAPRIVLPDGDVRGLEAHGLILGIDSDQEYEGVQDALPAGGSLVLYTDGVVEARRDGELYGTERLDALLAAHCELGPRELARRVADDARSWGGDALTDDLAVVVIRRTA